MRSQVTTYLKPSSSIGAARAPPPPAPPPRSSVRANLSDRKCVFVCANENRVDGPHPTPKRMIGGVEAGFMSSIEKEKVPNKLHWCARRWKELVFFPLPPLPICTVCSRPSPSLSFSPSFSSSPAPPPRSFSIYLYLSSFLPSPPSSLFLSSTVSRYLPPCFLPFLPTSEFANESGTALRTQ